jgi:hypothetical protein
MTGAHTDADRLRVMLKTAGLSQRAGARAVGINERTMPPVLPGGAGPEGHHAGGRGADHRGQGEAMKVHLSQRLLVPMKAG